jgi:hypothetical protein
MTATIEERSEFLALCGRIAKASHGSTESRPTDVADYAALRAEMLLLRIDAPGFDKNFARVFAAMEEIKNRNGGYAPGTEPR